MAEKAMEIKLLGHADILYGGVSIFDEQQLTAKLKSLLEYFLIHRGVLCKPEKITGELWPENSYIDAKKVLQTYVHRLRGILSKNNRFQKDFSNHIKILSTKGYYVLETNGTIKIDVELFENMVYKSMKATGIDSITNCAGTILNVYSGHFMSDNSHKNLVQGLQNHYFHLFCQTMEKLLDSLYGMGEYDQVIRLCHRVFKIDDMDERINGLFLRSLMKTGQQGYALRHFNYLDQKMRSSLGIKPSDKLYGIVNGGKSAVDQANAKVNKCYIESVVNQLIDDRFKAMHKMHYFAKIDFLNIDGVITQRCIEEIMAKSLEKNDMYTLLDSRSAVAVILSGKEEYLDKIKSKIISSVAEYFPGGGVKVYISMWPFSKVK